MDVFIDERLAAEEERKYYDRQQRPGREAQATVGHRFLSRASLTKSTEVLYATVFSYGGGTTTQSTIGLFGVSTWGDATFKEA